MGGVNFFFCQFFKTNYIKEKPLSFLFPSWKRRFIFEWAKRNPISTEVFRALYSSFGRGSSLKVRLGHKMLTSRTSEVKFYWDWKLIQFKSDRNIKQRKSDTSVANRNPKNGKTSISTKCIIRNKKRFAPLQNKMIC